MPHLSVRLFGSVEVTLDGEVVTAFKSDKARALLAYLVVEAERPHRREKLAGLLWPEWPERAARGNLRRVLSNLRLAIGDHQATPPFLHISHHTIQFNSASDAWIDATAFSELLEAKGDLQQLIGQLEEAVELYRGDFLEGFSIPDSAAFEEWALLNRERFRRLAMVALHRLARCHEQRGAYESALRHAWRQVELEPWREKGHQQVMRLLALSDQRGAALAQYESCRHLLAEELGVDPSRETTALYEQIRDGELSRGAEEPFDFAQDRRRGRGEFVAAAPAFLTSAPPPPSPPAPFVARERELARLGTFLEQALKGQSRVVFITGGPGRGKTALLGEFVRRAMDAHPDLLVARGDCSAYSGVGDPYLPFRDVMAMLTGDVEVRWAAGSISHDHARRLWDALPLAIQALLAHGASLIGTVLAGKALLSRAAAALPDHADWLERLQALTARARSGSVDLEQSFLFEQYTNVLRTLADQHPLVLVLDDVQWADNASISLLFHLGRRLAGTGSRILIACAYRPEEVALGRDGQRHPLEQVLREFKRTLGDVWVDLDQVDQAEGRRFVDAFLDTEPNRLGEGFRAALFHRTEGHPLFTVELLRVMQERGDLVRDMADGAWIEGPTLDWEKLPARVEAVIEQRVNRLDPELKEIASVASVEGEVFTAQVVAAVLKRAERPLLHRLSQDLEGRHRLVREQAEVQTGPGRMTRYRFGHILIQNHLYKQLSRGERRLLHGEVAAALENLYEGQLDEIAVQLARHWELAGDAEKAVHYLLQAGDQARLAYAHVEAIDYYQRGLEFLKEREAFEEASRTLMKLGLTYHTAFDYTASRQAYDEAFAMRQRERIAPPAALAPAPHPLRLVRLEPPTLDSTIQNYETAEFYIENIFSGLVELGTGWEIIPDVAQSWEISEDGCRYVFHLRDDVYWSDSTQVTAADFVYAWKRTLNPATEAPWGAARLLYDIKNAKAYHLGEISDPDQVGARAIGELALEVELERPASYFLQTLRFKYPVPQHVVEAHGDDWTDLGNLVTNGPFHLESYQPGESIILVRNPAYHGRFSGNLQRVEVKLNVSRRSSENLEMYESDSVDIVSLGESIYPARHLHVEEYISEPWPSTWLVGFNTSRPPFDDPRVRRAFVMAMDREKLADEVLEGYLYPATGGFVPPGMPGHSPGIGLPYDPVKARQLLAQAGYPEGRSFPNLELVSGRFRNVLEFLKAQWLSNLNVEVTMGIREWAKVLKEAHSSDLSCMGWSTEYHDPEYFLGLFIRSQVHHWRDGNYDLLLKEARRTSNQGDRIPLYQAADKILIEEAVIMPIFYGRRHRLVKPWVKIPGGGTGIWHLKDVIIEPH